MRKSIFLFPFFLTFKSFGQTFKTLDSFYFKIDTSVFYKVDSKNFRTPSISILQTNLTIDKSRISANPYQSLYPLKVYKHSSTIFDVVRFYTTK